MSRPPGGAAGARLRLLVVAYYFPPAGGAGVQRVLKWVKYLPQHGVDPVVVTVREGAYPQLDPTLRTDVPDGVPVIRTAAPDPFGLYGRLTGKSRRAVVAARTDHVGVGGGAPERAARWLRANIVLPDARVGWVPFATWRGARLSRQRGLDAVLTTGPPHSAHLSGLALRAATGLPWVADLRDPWTDIHYYRDLPRTRLAQRLDGALERAVLRRADVVTTVSPSWAGLLAERARRHVGVIHNGFDPEDFQAPQPQRRQGVFTVAHVGSLYDARNPLAFWDAATRLAAVDGPPLHVRVIGRVGEGVREAASRAGVSVEWTGYLPHAHAVDAMRAADVLLLSTEPHDAEAGHITGKLYEYLASGVPVLGLGAPDGDAAALLANTAAGRVFARDDVAGVHAFLLEARLAAASGSRLDGASWAALAPYARDAQAAQLAEIVRTITQRSAP